MLPKQVFEELTRAAGLRSEPNPRERRRSPRIAVRVTTTVHSVRGGCVGPGVAVRLRDISLTGASVLTVGKDKPPRDFLLRMESRVAQGTDSGEVWILCGMRRQSELDRTCTLTCATYLRLLGPGQTLSVGESVGGLMWLDVAEPVAVRASSPAA